MALPLYQEVVVGMDSYHVDGVLRQLAQSPDVARTWRKGTTPVSVQLRGGGVVKSLNQFDRHGMDEATFMGFLAECERHGVERPSSYADVFHQLFVSPHIPYTVNHFFIDHFAGAWQEAREMGIVKGHLFKYDLNSAYLWSGTQGLPKPHTFRYCDDLHTRDALFLLKIEPNVDAPFPFNRHKYVVAQRADIDLYELDVKRVVAGVQWRGQIDGDEILKVTDRFSFRKQIARSYWGRWASKKPIRCATLEKDTAKIRKEWNLRNPALNYVWAQLIINRVKRRVYEYDPCPIHVFVDSIITRHQITTSTDIGGWKLVGEYPRGLSVLGPGWYGVPGGKLEKHAGVHVA